VSVNIRELIKKHQEEQALRAYLKGKYDTTSAAEKRKFLQAVSSTIEQEVDRILSAFAEEIQANSPANKKRRWVAFGILAVTALLTPGIGYAVNIENWTFVWILSAALLLVQVYNVFND